MKVVIVILFFLQFFVSCTPKELTPDSYIQWVEDSENGLYKKDILGSLNYELLYKPTDYIIAIENKSNVIPTEYYNSRKRELGTMRYFTFKVSSIDKEHNVVELNSDNESSVSERLNYLSFEMAKDFKLLIGKEIIPCSLYHFEQQNGIYSTITLLLGFSVAKPVLDRDFTFIYDNHLNNEPGVRFLYESSLITNIPTLKINSNE